MALHRGRAGPAYAGPLPWSRAWAAAALGPRGFYSAGTGALDGPGRHFRTSVHVGPVFHEAVAALLSEVDERLGRPEHLDLLDVGAGGGELLSGVLTALPPAVAARVRPVALDVRDRPAGLDRRITWIRGVAPGRVPRGVRGLVLAHEWLDDLPLDIVQVDDDGIARLVLVDLDGRETLGPAISDDLAWQRLGVDPTPARAWLTRWWPVAEPGERAEIGLPRDQAWERVVAALEDGTALAVDYGHTAAERGSRQHGWLSAYRDGRQCRAAPDGSANITAHVALDSLAAAVGATVTTQRQALRSLGVSAGLPDEMLAATDPGGYLDRLARASDAAELLDPAGLGGFGWVRLDR